MHIEIGTADIGFHPSGFGVAQLETEKLALSASDQRKLLQRLTSGILISPYEPASAQQNPTEVTNDDHSDVLNTAQYLKHGLACRT